MDLFGIGGIAQAVATVGAATIQSLTAKQIMDKQLAAVKKARNFVFNNLNPDLINRKATIADIERTKQRLALQANIDPALAKLRQSAQQQLLEQTGQIGKGVQEELGAVAAANALEGNQRTTDLKNRLIDAAMQELDAGATLPADVQAELVKAGLEQSGTVTGGNTGPSGVSGTMARKLIGREALALKAQRQASAQQLTATASNLESQRQQILASLFPSLNAMQLQNIQATAGALGVSNQMVPEAGLGGSDIANLWLARVGATNQLNQSAADIASRGAAAQGSIFSGAVGQLGNQVSSAFPQTASPRALTPDESYALDYAQFGGI